MFALYIRVHTDTISVLKIYAGHKSSALYK